MKDLTTSLSKIDLFSLSLLKGLKLYCLKVIMEYIYCEELNLVLKMLKTLKSE